MSVLRLYTDSALTDMISIDAAFTNPDEVASLDGTAGDTDITPLWIAPEQTTLSAGIDDTTTTVPLTAARFADTDYPVIIIGTEKMLITGGAGTTSLTVTRGHNGTTQAAHLISVDVILAYDSSAVTIDCIDNSGTDESGWVTYCDDDGGGSPDGSYAAPHTPGAGTIAYSASAAIHRKIVVPASTAAALKRDLVHRLAATVNETT